MHKLPAIIKTLVIAVMILTLAACATTAKSPAEKQLEQQSEWFSSSHLQGCLLGAAMGGGICALAGGNTAACISSAAAGCGLGLAAAEYMAQQRRKYASEEEALQAIIADVKQDNQKVASYLKAERDFINEKLKELDQIERNYAQKKISLDEAKKQVADLRNTQKRLEEMTKGLRNVEKQWQERYAMTNDPRIAQEVQSLSRQVDAAHQDVRNYTERLNVSTVG